MSRGSVDKWDDARLGLADVDVVEVTSHPKFHRRTHEIRKKRGEVASALDSPPDDAHQLQGGPHSKAVTHGIEWCCCGVAWPEKRQGKFISHLTRQLKASFVCVGLEPSQVGQS
ncbi:hypothetical protein LWF01_02570 [Saxibacter everestensis]|uniref:Uncharacterized protein n=1 Tax=Saxibacter everestensis TaxID=2909229 RepID=A0ABY8QWB4_9MICO|nr:hypothetical protein LWF01_02570 [Brevibacteriaceae bacterium ZFBP1038]